MTLLRIKSEQKDSKREDGGEGKRTRPSPRVPVS